MQRKERQGKGEGKGEGRKAGEPCEEKGGGRKEGQRWPGKRRGERNGRAGGSTREEHTHAYVPSHPTRTRRQAAQGDGREDNNTGIKRRPPSLGGIGIGKERNQATQTTYNHTTVHAYIHTYIHTYRRTHAPTTPIHAHAPTYRQIERHTS